MISKRFEGKKDKNKLHRIDEMLLCMSCVYLYSVISLENKNVQQTKARIPINIAHAFINFGI